MHLKSLKSVVAWFSVQMVPEDQNFTNHLEIEIGFLSFFLATGTDRLVRNKKLNGAKYRDTVYSDLDEASASNKSTPYVNTRFF